MTSETKREAAKVLRSYLLHNGPQLLPEFVSVGKYSAAKKHFISILYFDADLDIDWELNIIKVKSVEKKVFSRIDRILDKSARFDLLIKNVLKSKNCSLYPFILGKSQEELEKVALDYYCRADKTCVWGDRVYFETLQRPPSLGDYPLIGFIRTAYPSQPIKLPSKSVVQPQRMSKSHSTKGVPPQKEKAVQSAATEAFPENCDQTNDANLSDDDEGDSVGVHIPLESLQFMIRQGTNCTIKFLLSVLQRNPLFYSRYGTSITKKETGFSFESNDYDRTWKHSKNNRSAAISLSNRLLMQWIVNQLRKEKVCSLAQLCKKLHADDMPFQAFMSVQGFTVFELVNFILSNCSAEIEFRDDRFRIKRNKVWDKICFELVESQAQKITESKKPKQDSPLASTQITPEDIVETPASNEVAIFSNDNFPKPSYCRPLPSRKSKKKSDFKLTNQRKVDDKKYKFNKASWNDSSKQKPSISANKEFSTNHEVNVLLFEYQPRKPPSANQKIRKSFSTESSKGKTICSPKSTGQKTFEVKNSQAKKKKSESHQSDTYNLEKADLRIGREQRTSCVNVEFNQAKDIGSWHYIDDLRGEAATTMDGVGTGLGNTVAEFCSPELNTNPLKFSGRSFENSNMVESVKNPNKQFVTPVCASMLASLPIKQNMAQVSRFIRSPRPIFVPSQTVNYSNPVFPVQHSSSFSKAQTTADLENYEENTPRPVRTQLRTSTSPVTVQSKGESASLAQSTADRQPRHDVLHIRPSQVFIDPNVSSKHEVISSILKNRERVHINILFLRCQLQQSFLFHDVKDLYAQVMASSDLCSLHDCWVTSTASRS